MQKILFILILLLGLNSSCALQSDVIYIDDRVDAIEKKMSVRNMASGDAEKGFRTQYARLNNQIEKLDEMIRRIEGRFEEIDFALKSQKDLTAELKMQNDSIGPVVSALEVKIGNLESYTGFTPSDAQTTEKSPAGDEVGPVDITADNAEAVQLDDILLYEKGKAAFVSGKFKTARAVFLDLIKQFPGSDNADNAQFWIGEIYYKNKKYKTAILEYQKVIDDFPEGNKVAGAYLKQALAFAALGEPDTSELILNDLIKLYPKSGETIIAKKKIATMEKK